MSKLSNQELQILLTNIEIDYYRDSQNFDIYTLEDYTNMKIDEYLGV